MSLISTGDIRTWLGIAASDTGPNAKIASLILAVEGFCNNYTNHKLQCAYYTTAANDALHDGMGEHYFYTKQFPVSWIGTIWNDGDRVWDSASIVPSADLVIDWDSGKIINEEGRFLRGTKNILMDYIAGYGTSIIGTYSSSYPLPDDLKQVMIEMVVDGFKSGLVGLHREQNPEETQFVKMFNNNGFWKMTLDKYKTFYPSLSGNM